MAEQRRPVALPARMGTVRVRTTVAAVVVVGIALLAGSVALVVVLRQTLTREVRDAARLRAREVVATLEASEGVVPVVVRDDEEVIQVIDQDGDVVASSPNIEGEAAVARLRPGESAEIKVPFEDDDFLAIAAAVHNGDGELSVIVARAIDDATEPAQAVTGLLTIGSPIMLLVVAGTTWKVVGRALAPVEAIRREVEGISAAQLHRRVPHPPTDDEIARLARTMNRMLGRLERAYAQQHRFVSDASHELRSPVASIRQHVEVALAHPERTTTSELAQTVLAEDLRVQRLVDDLLVLAKVDERTLGLRRREVDVDDLVLDEARRLRDATDVRIDTTGVSAGRVLGDAAGLARVVRNLGENAARHARTHVSFALRDRASTVVLTVEDDGPGIPRDQQERVFERFVRLDDARARDAGGSGLGLAIVAELVAAHGGTCTAADSGLGGALFTVTLPSRCSGEAASAEARADPATPRGR